MLPTAILAGLGCIRSLGRRGVLIAAVIALPVQIASFTILQHYRGRVRGFMAAWVGGTLLRMTTIAVVAVVVIRSGAAGRIPMLFALASFFFGLLLLEPVYFKASQGEMGGSGR